MNVESLWENFLEKIKSRISSLSYETWFKTTKLVSLDNNIAKVLVDLPIQKKQLQEVWYKTIVEVFRDRKSTRLNSSHRL